MPESRTILKKGRKFDQVLDAARTVFMTDGFERANMDDIARVAGVSKATVYSYFPDKRLLFLEAAKTEIKRRALDAESGIPDGAPVEIVLEFTARVLVGFFLSEFGKNLYRICVANVETFPDLGQMFYETGPHMALLRLSDYFAQATTAGILAVADPDLAAAQFVELCKAEIYTRSVLGLTPEVEDAEISRVIKGAVEMFLARYGV